MKIIFCHAIISAKIRIKNAELYICRCVRIIAWFILIHLLLVNNLSSQPHLEAQKKIADSLYFSELYFEAITEYKRLKYFDNEKRHYSASDEMIARAYKNGAKVAEAKKHFYLAALNSNDKEKIFELRLEYIRMNILAKEFYQTRAALDNLKKNETDSIKLKQIKYWNGWNFMFAGRWENASEIFEELGETELKSICDNVINEKYSVSLAVIFSLILPGAGQVYSGEYLSGVMSFVWNVLCGYWTLTAFAEDRVFDGVAIASLLWTRFFAGNISNAKKFTEKNNVNISNNALNYLQNSFKGKKP